MDSIKICTTNLVTLLIFSITSPTTHDLQTLLKKKGGHFRMLAEKAAGDMGMVMEMFEKGAAGLVNGHEVEENGGGQEMTAISK